MTIHTKAPQSIDEKIDRILGLGGGVIEGTEVTISIEAYKKRAEKIKELFRTETPQRTDMEVSKIEDLAKKIAMFPDSDDLLPEDMLIDYDRIKVGDVYNLITQAKQAGIDEAVERALKPFKGTKNPGEWEDLVWWAGRRHALSLVEKWVASNATTKDTSISDFPDQWVYEVDAIELIDYLNHLKTQPSDDTIKALTSKK